MQNKWWLIPVVSVMSIAQLLISCEKEEVTNEILVPGLGISQVMVGANGGETLLKISPSADWKAVSKAPWLKVSPASGTKADKEIKLIADPNDSFESRPAVLELTIGDSVLVNTVIQEGIQKDISIYSGKIVFGWDMKEIIVSPITSNVEMKAIAFPSWIESVDVREVPEGYFTATIRMKDYDLDDELRKDTIIFGDDAGYIKKFPIECEALSNRIIVNVPDFTTPFDGLAQEIKFTVYNNTTEGYRILFFQYLDGGMGMPPFNEDWIKEVSGASASAAVEGKEHTLALKAYNESGRAERQVAFCIVPESEVKNYDPRGKTFYLISQKNAYVLPEITISGNISADGKTPATVTVKVKTGVKFEPMAIYNKMGRYNDVFEATASGPKVDFEGLESPVAIALDEKKESGDYETYTYRLTSQVPNFMPSQAPLGFFVILLKNADDTYATYKETDYSGEEFDAYMMVRGEILIDGKK